MAREYLKDVTFLKALDEMRIKEHFITLQVLNFKEEPLRQIQGIATAGNISVNGSSAVRRTINLTLVAPEGENDLSNIDNIISANKKIKVELGIKNPFSNYKYYGDIIWFPVGMFLITEATSTTSATNATITLKGKDKMCLLDGTCGGTLPATVTFHEAQEVDANGNVSVVSIPIFTIIKECVRHYGQEIEQNIVINDIDLVAKQSVQYIGTEPIWFDESYQLSPAFGENPNKMEYTNKFVYGQDIGYIETDFTFPGELVFEAGETVTTVLDKIIQTLGNYEYFYDLDGHFVFQQKKNYLNNYYTPIVDLNDSYYIRAFSDSKYYTTFENAKDSISYFNSPKYDNLKNDFVVWGVNTDSDGVTRNIKYHLAIDEKPLPDLAMQYMWEAKDGNGNHLFYVLDYNDRPEFENSSSIQEPIVLKYDDNVQESDIINHITNYLNTNFLTYIGKKATFILWFKVIWNKQNRYYYAKINEGIIKQIIYYEEYTTEIKDEQIVIGIHIPKEEEKKEDNEGEDLLPDSNSEMDTEQKTFSLTRNATQEEEKEEKKYFTALSIYLNEDDSYSLGYYDKDQIWQNVYSLGEEKEISFENLSSILSKIGSNYLMRVYTFKDFNKDNKYNFNDIDILNSVINISEIEKVVEPQKLVFDNGKIADFYYQFNNISFNDEIILEADQRKTLITSLAKFYPDQRNELVEDIATVYNEGKGENLLPTYNPDMDTEVKFGSQLAEWKEILQKIESDPENSKFKVIDSSLAALIYSYAYAGYTQGDLIMEIVDYWGNNVIESVNEKYIISVITEKTEEPELDYGENIIYTLIGLPLTEEGYEWREELYRQALLTNESAGEPGYYDDELLAFWRDNFDTTNAVWQSEWIDFINENWTGWNPAIYRDPGLLTFWLDFLDDEQLVAKYSVNQIGRRTKAIVKENIKMLYKLEVPDVIFLLNTDNDKDQKISEYIAYGQKYFTLKQNQMNYFTSSATGSTAFDLIREMLYTYLSYNTSITINCIPKYYLEPNNLVYISDKKSHIQGDYVITQFTVPLTYNGTMTINATQALTRV